MSQRKVGRSVLGSISGGIFLIGLAIAFWVSSQFGGNFFLPILFATLAFTSVFGSISSLNPKAVYGSLYGFVWLLGLGILFLPGVGFWPWILVLCGVSAIIGALSRPIISTLGGYIRITNAAQQNTDAYKEAQYSSYQEGYQPPTETYQEENRQSRYQPQPKYDQAQYEEPQTNYPQELPPMQQ